MHLAEEALALELSWQSRPIGRHSLGIIFAYSSSSLAKIHHRQRHHDNKHTTASILCPPLFISSIHPFSGVTISLTSASFRTMAEPTSTHGWTAVPRDTSALFNGKKNVKDPELVTVDSILLPETPLAKNVLEYAQKELREETFNHSMRVFYYGTLLRYA